MMNSITSSIRPSTSAHGAYQEEGRRGAFSSKNGSPPASADSSDEMSTPPYILWAKSLEHVLNDREALDLFISWLNSCDNGDAVNLNAIKFYYAIRGYKNKLAEMQSAPREDVETATRDVRRLAYEVYQVFIRDTGDKLCQFIRPEVREEVRAAVKSTTGLPHSQLFDQCEAAVMTVLRTQHAAFSQSDELMVAINRIERGEPSDGSLLSTRSPSVASQRLDEDSVVREVLDEASDEESAVAHSTMTGYSDAVTEPVTSTAGGPPPLPPRRETSPKNRKPPPVAAKKPAKSGRMLLTLKTLISTQTQRSNAVDQRSVPPPYATASRPMPYVCAANTSKNDSAVSSAFSSEASAGQPYQPGQSYHLSSRQNRDEQARHNPRNRNAIPRNDFLKAQQGPADLHATQDQRRDFYNKVCAKLNVLFYKREMEAFTVEKMSAIGTKQQDARTAVAAVAEFERRGQQHNVNDEEEDVDVYLNRMNDSNKPSPGSQRSPGGFFAVTHYRQRRSPKSTSPGPDHHRFAVASHSAMTSSFPTPYGLQGFAPPPIAAKQKPFTSAYQFQPHPDHTRSTAHGFSANRRTEQTRPRLAASDTSGIGTGTSSADYSHVHDSQPAKKAYEKLKQMSTGSSATQKRQKIPSVAASMPYNSSSLPRQGRSQPTTLPFSSSATSSPHNMHVRQSVDAEMTIGYYTSKEVDKHVPYVKKVPSKPLTFKEFKHHFALGKNKNDQFFFKRSSDDPQNPFELLLVTEDAEMLPVFEGKVMAELKSVTDSD